MTKLREADAQMVTGIFHNYETPGSGATVCYKKYPGEAVFKQAFQDGEKYTIPMGVAKHINSCHYPVHKYITDDAGRTLPIIGQKIKRYAFTPTEFFVE